MNPNLVDIHCHLDFKDFDNDREEVIKRAGEKNIWIINIGIDKKTSQRSIEIAEKHEGVFAGIGLHPSEAKENFDADYYRKLATHPKVVAIGECGIDLKSPAEGEARQGRQRDIFEQQIELAIELDKPLMIHCRQAHKEVIEILKESKHYGNIHFFSGTWKEARQYFDLGFTISFTGVITFTRDYDEIIRKAPLEKIMIETDAPFVAPVPYRGQRCEPLYVAEIAKKIAEIKNLSLEEVAETTTKNALRLFGLN